MAVMFLALLTLSVLWTQVVGGPCPRGFEQHAESCYALLRAKASWAESEHYCESVGADLVVIDDPEEEVFIDGMLTRLAPTIKTSQVWIGGTDLLEEGNFVAPKTLQPLNYLHWAPGEPDDLGGQHCLAIFMGNTLLWDDNNCEVQNFPLCERPFGNGPAEIIG